MKDFIGKERFFNYIVPKTDKNIICIIKKIIRKFLKILKLSKKIIIHYDIDEIYPNTLNKYVKKIDKIYKFDVIWVEYVWYSKILETFDNNKVKIIDTHDVFSNREQLFLKNGEEPKWYYTTKIKEGKGLSRANYVIAIQEEENKFFKKIVKSDVNVVTVGNTIEIHRPCKVYNKNFMFVGSNNDLNITSIKYFINNLLPKIKIQNPEAEFYIVGSVCNSIPDSDKYIKLGFVKDIEEAYKNVRLVVNPIQNGTGLNIKTIEALGYSKPLITTVCGAKGLDLEKNCYIIARNDEEFCKKVTEVLNSNLLTDKLSKEAFDFANNYNTSCIQSLKRIFE